MKKFLCFLLSVVMLFSLVGCFGGNTGDVRGTVAADPTEAKEESFSFGKSTGSTYRNDFLGLTFQAPAGWEFYSDQQILETNNLVGEVLDEEAAKQMENATIIYDMFVNNATEGSSANVNLEKLNVLQIAALDIKQTLEAQIDTIKSTYENMGYSDAQVVYEKFTVDGKEFDGLRITAKIQDIDFYCTVFTFRKGSYLANVTASSLQTDKTADILGCFTIG